MSSITTSWMIRLCIIVSCCVLVVESHFSSRFVTPIRTNDRNNCQLNHPRTKTTSSATITSQQQRQRIIRGGGYSNIPLKTMTARRMETFKFLSGGVAGTVAACVTNPLEVIKAQLQSSNKELLNANPVELSLIHI